MLSVDIEKTPFYQIGEKRGEKRGIEKGIEKGIEIVANQMLALKMNIDTISQVTGLSIEQIENLQKG